MHNISYLYNFNIFKRCALKYIKDSRINKTKGFIYCTILIKKCIAFLN